MKISTKGRYALRVMIDLATHQADGLIPLHEIAEREGITVKYLEQIIAQLNRAGFLHSVRGKSCGYRLQRKTEEYTVGEILRASEGKMFPAACVSHEGVPCDRQGDCPAQAFWVEFYENINQFLDSKTLCDLIPGRSDCPSTDPN